MKKGIILRDFLAIYSLLLSGMLFHGTPTDGAKTLSLFVAILLCAIPIFLLYALSCRFSKKNAFLKKNALSERRLPTAANNFFTAVGAALCGTLVAAYVLEFWNTGAFSEHFSSSDGAYAKKAAFCVLSVLLSLFLSKGGTTALSRIAGITLPFLLLIPLLTFFAFRGFRPFGELFPRLEVSFNRKLFWRAFSDAAVFFGYSLLYCMKNPSEAKEHGRAFAPTAAAVLFLLTLFVEGAKQLIFFGEKGVSALSRPDRTLLATISSFNVREIFIFGLYFSFILRMTCAFCICRELLCRLFSKNNQNGAKMMVKRIVQKTAVVLSGAVAGFLVHELAMVDGKKITAVAVIMILVGFFARERLCFALSLKKARAKDDV